MKFRHIGIEFLKFVKKVINIVIKRNKRKLDVGNIKSE